MAFFLQELIWSYKRRIISAEFAADLFETANELHTAKNMDLTALLSIIKGTKTPPGCWATLLVFLNLQQRRGVAPSAQRT